jgi:MSHA pilin protein MshD
MTRCNRQQNQSGITLVELIVSIVVIAVAVTGVLLAVQFTTRHSADPMIRQQAVAIADAYMEEILLQSYNQTGGINRPTFNDVYDYNQLSENHEPKDQTNSSLDLNNYRVTVEVNSTDSFGPNDNTTAAEIEVTVEHTSADVSFTLTGYKTKY